MKTIEIKTWKHEIIRLKKTGFFHILTSQIVSKIITFSSNVWVVWILSKSDFGIYSYANNIISMFLLLSGLGASSGLLQYGSENRDNPHKLAAYSRFALKMGLSVNAIICVLIVVFALSFNLKLEGTLTILLLMTFIPITSEVFSQIIIGFRIRLENKAFSFLGILNSGVLIICTIAGACFFAVKGVIVFQYAGFAICIIAGFIMAKRCGHTLCSKLELTINEKKSFIKLSFISGINNCISQMLYLLDIFMIGIIISNAGVIAAYKTATTIPFSMLFVPMAIMTYVYPLFASHNKEREWVRHRYCQLLIRLVLLNGIISISMYLCAPWIIKYIFGSSYMDSVEPFRILSIGYFIAATFRIPSGNILVSLHRVTFNLYNALASGIVNILLNIILITWLGSIGAAYATVIVYIISSSLSSLYLKKVIDDRSKPLVI